LDQLAEITWVETVDVFGRVNRSGDSQLVDAFGSRALDQYPVYGVVGIQIGHDFEDVILRGRRRQVDASAQYAASLTGALLVADVDLTRGILTGDDHG
jgi:hypothetical protein